MAPRRAKVNKFDYTKLTKNDVLCPVCRTILIDPITLPCSHNFCASCFGPTTQNANVVCPLCRVRVGSWLRTATKSKKLINHTLWQAIKETFPRQVKNKLNGIDENFIDDQLTSIVSSEIQSAICLSKNNNKLDVADNAAGSTAQTTNENILSSFAKKFAEKEYTCRILCQNMPAVSKRSSQADSTSSFSLIQKKHKQITKITQEELVDSSRSNSIESECLYFRPIDYRNNPPSEGLAPIKVPTRKPNVISQIKILAPSGQNRIMFDSLMSAFAKLNKAGPDEKQLISIRLKRKSDHVEENAAKKRLRSYRKSMEDDSFAKNNNLSSTKRIVNAPRKLAEEKMTRRKIIVK